MLVCCWVAVGLLVCCWFVVGLLLACCLFAVCLLLVLLFVCCLVDVGGGLPTPEEAIFVAPVRHCECKCRDQDPRRVNGEVDQAHKERLEQVGVALSQPDENNKEILVPLKDVSIHARIDQGIIK